jgi:type II secretory pathway component PulJ
MNVALSHPKASSRTTHHAPRITHHASRLTPQTAFTLIEVVISSSLMALILVSSYLCLNAALATQKLVEPRVEVLQNARVAMALMAADLRCACILDKDSEFLGMHRMLGEIEADNLDFATHNYTPRRAREGDFCEVSFYVDKNPETGELSLFRRRNPTIALDPLSGGNREELAKGVLGFKLEYYDGFDWYESWGQVDRRTRAQSSLRERSNLYGLPEAVRITLWFNSNPKAKPAAPAEKTDLELSPKPTAEPPLVFQTVARLNLTASTQRTSGGAPGSDAQDTSATQTPGPNQGGNQ